MNLKERQKAESRVKILEAASQLFRQQGFEATGVDQLMAKAGLTAGAFYAHFNSKKELLFESLRMCLQQNEQALLRGLERAKGASWIEAVLDRYVSAAHRDHPHQGCPLVSLGPELHRASPKLAKIISPYISSMIERIAQNLPDTTPDKKELAIRIFSQAVGGLLLSRLVDSESLSNDILNATRKVPHE